MDDSMICISSGHGKLIRGASGYLDEVDEARKVVRKVAQILRRRDVLVKTFNDDTSTTQDENLETIVDWHNNQERELDVSVHFNSFRETDDQPMKDDPIGTEVFYATQDDLALRVSEAIAEAGGLINRGAKTGNLYFLNNTDEPAILIEVCFVDSSADAETYRYNFEEICQAIANAIA